MKIRQVVNFTVSEKRGILVLIALILVLVLLRIYLPFYLAKSQVSKFELSYLKLTESKEKSDNTKSEIKLELKKEDKQYHDIVPIDPNKASYDDLIRAGFSPFISSNIIKYRNSGGRFSKPSDIYKIYGVDSGYCEIISQNIDIEKDTLEQKTTLSDKHIKVNICIAGTEELEYLPGIGTILSERIVKYRELLGGYVDVKQIKEVYGITDSTFKLIEHSIFTEPEKYQGIGLNTATTKELYKHPYITKYQAKAIIKYREVVGKFTSIEELAKNNILDSLTLKKVGPYLIIE